MLVDPRRTLTLNKKEPYLGTVIYWMSRDQRVEDNWAIFYALEKANEMNQKMVVVFCLEKYSSSNLRQYDFMLRGIKKISEDLEEIGIGFKLLLGSPEEVIPKYSDEIKAGIVISDFFPLKNSREKKKKVASLINIPFVVVDAHNIIPTWFASIKQEFAAYTFRPKVNYLLPEFLTEFPKLEKPNKTWDKHNDNIDVDKLIEQLKIDESVKPVEWIIPGEKEALKSMTHFINNKLDNYGEGRNDPNADALSNLSPYLHFGQLSAQRLALEIKNSEKNSESIKAYLEELIVRRELADNFTFYNKNYANPDGFPEWAKKSHKEHIEDKRVYNYSLKVLEQGKTHDDVWNAAQHQMVNHGKMHGYLRMYWAKKILEWTENPETAMKYAIYLNDKYELDGRDPNGYVGIAWSIGGVHDRAWFTRPIFGKIRYMSYSGLEKKFDIKEYIKNNS